MWLNFLKPAGAFTWKTHHGEAQNVEDSPYSISLQFQTETVSLTEEEVVEMSLRKKNNVTRKLKAEIKKSENAILKALYFLSENSLKANIDGPYAKKASDKNSMVWDQL